MKKLSKHINEMNSNIKERVRKIVREIMQEKVLEEITASDNIAGYSTPHAFKGVDDDDAYTDRLTIGTGYTLVGEAIERCKKHCDNSLTKLNEATNRYQELRKDERTPNQKIGVGIRNIRKQLQEIEKFITWYSKIKSESGLERDAYWKRTHRHLNKIKERLNTLSDKINKL